MTAQSFQERVKIHFDYNFMLITRKAENLPFIKRVAELRNKL